MQRKVPEAVGACFDLIETRMLKGPWVMGQNYTIADPYPYEATSFADMQRKVPEAVGACFDLIETGVFTRWFSR